MSLFINDGRDLDLSMKSKEPLCKDNGRRMRASRECKFMKRASVKGRGGEAGVRVCVVCV